MPSRSESSQEQTALGALGSKTLLTSLLVPAAAAAIRTKAEPNFLDFSSHFVMQLLTGKKTAKTRIHREVGGRDLSCRL